MKTAYQNIYLMDSDLKSSLHSTSLEFRNVHYVNTIGHCTIAKTVYQDINLMDLEAAGPSPTQCSKTYMQFLSFDI